ncbi:MULTISPECIES: response regulator transcription factor [unclassified Flavobacterium]|uniref:response regulator transcription factor n=1 Tax=unclassified Flavobacterium TaxID=196869 RepID=UPI000A360F2E|nr:MULTISPECIES: response regulator transcription factor [unclassified Flavobacterium]OUD36239.1 DNA-binding response regulator [Flavobacterium sp. FPG59]
MKNSIKIIIVDDEILFRKGISFLLDRENNIDVIYEASSGGELLAFLESNHDNHPDIIIMDLKMQGINGVEATKIIHTVYPSIKIIALTSYNTKSFILNMIAVGAVAYLVKNSTPQELLVTINEVAERGYYYTDYIMKVIQEDISTVKKTKCILDPNFLTTREIQILKLICDQKSSTEIADTLFISPRTVEGHRNNLLLKTESRNIAGLVLFAIQYEIMAID